MMPFSGHSPVAEQFGITAAHRSAELQRCCVACSINACLTRVLKSKRIEQTFKVSLLGSMCFPHSLEHKCSMLAKLGLLSESQI